MAAFFAGFGAGLLLGGGAGFLLYALFVAGADRPELTEAEQQAAKAWVAELESSGWERLERDG